LSNLKRPPEHPFWVAGKGWVAAKELAKGDRLITPDEKVAVVGEARVEAVRGPPVAVYNLEVENTHTYFVGRSGVWVHNACNQRITTVIGRMEDTLRYEGVPGYNVLNDPAWTWPKNVSWLAEAYRRGDKFLVVSEELGKYSQAELKLLQYWQQVGKRTVEIVYLR